MKNKSVYLIAFFLLAMTRQAFAGVTAQAFNQSTDVDYSQIDFTILGICICGAPPYMTEGLLYEYWEPFLVIDTSSAAYYSAYEGRSFNSSDSSDSLWGSSGGDSGGGGNETPEESGGNQGGTPDTGGSSSSNYTSNFGVIGQLTMGGKNKSQDAVDNGESTFAQAHGWLIPILPLCSRSDYGMYFTEWDAMWQTDTLTAIIEPEAALFANPVSQLACMGDAVAANLGFPLDSLFWCVGSGGSAYPMTGHVADDNTVQANSTIASRLIYRLNRLFMICDPGLGDGCGCTPTPIWVKSHYKMAVRRPGPASVYPLGRSATLYGAGVNIPYQGLMGPNDEFMWVVYRLKICCTCCD